MPSQESNPNTLNQRGLAAYSARQFARAEQLYREAIRLAPAASQPWQNLGALLYSLGRLEEAEEAFSSALDGDKAPARYSLGMTLLRQGKYTRGWRLFEARRELPTAPVKETDLPIPYWRGEPLAGKQIVLFPEQGLGDTIQFARFGLRLRDLGATVTLACPPALAPLFKAFFTDVRIAPLEGNVQLGEPDYWALLGSLPHLLNLGGELTEGYDYLKAPPVRALSTRPRIGFATRGNPDHANDARRSLDEPTAQRLRELLGVEVISLHREDSGDFVQTADIIAGLDLVVSVDTAIGHLAGAMDKPTLLLVPGFNADWRWLDGCAETAWYPRHRLFRSDLEGDWGAALSSVGTIVAQLRASRGRDLS